MKLEFEALALRPIGAEQLAAARELAGGSPRHRAIVRYHEHHESLQRMLHAIEPSSYVRPHLHDEPPRTEVFLALAGAALVCQFDAHGELRATLEIRAGGPQQGVEIPPGVWHGLLAIEPGTVLYEVVDGPFDPQSHKHYAEWAPAEGSAEGAAFLEALRDRLGLKPLCARQVAGE